MAQKALYGFIKLGRKEHIEDLYYNGTIYMNPIKKFKEIEDNHVRGDIHEGSHYVEQGNYLRIKLDDEIIDLHKVLKNFNCQLYREYNCADGNIYSLYSFLVEEGQERIFIDKRNLEFGDTCLYIQDADTFISRIKKALDEKGLKYYYGMVQYYNYRVFSGHAGIFHKSNKFDYQNEFRFYVENETNKPLILKIDSIEDIATKLNSKSLLDIEIIE